MRCEGCGNKTRFDVYESKRTKTFHHFSLGGEDVVEEEEVFETSIEKVVCRWCGASDQIVQGGSSREEISSWEGPSE